MSSKGTDMESFARADLVLTKFSFGREDPNTTKSGPLNAFCWRAYDVPTLNADLVAL